MGKTRSYKETLDEALRDPRDAAAYIDAAMREEDEEGILLAIRTVAEVHGIREIADKTKLSRESLYRTLSEKGNPTLHTLREVLHTFGLRLSVTAENNRAAHA